MNNPLFTNAEQYTITLERYNKDKNLYRTDEKEFNINYSITESNTHLTDDIVHVLLEHRYEYKIDRIRVNEQLYDYLHMKYKNASQFIFYYIDSVLTV